MTYRIIQGSNQNITFNAAAGASVQCANPFGAQTRVIRVCASGAYTATGGVRIEVGDNPTASNTSPLLPLNVIDYLIVSPGQKIAALSNDTIAGVANQVALSVAECTT